MRPPVVFGEHPSYSTVLSDVKKMMHSFFIKMLTV